MDMALSLLMLGALVLLAGALYLWRSRNERQRPLLMVLLAMIMLVNVGIWTLPDASGEAPVARADR
ncbi:MAG: hypothetical protein Q8R44_15250 [Novosphingobium sp.]|nr:hypothetical protein [Novosphingobium sp.]